jgi:hypothetical protein
MKKHFFCLLPFVVLMLTFLVVKSAGGNNVYKTISESSVFIENTVVEGSGVVFTRKDSTHTNDISFVWTAGHLINSTRIIMLQLFSYENITNRIPGVLNMVSVTHFPLVNSRIVKTNKVIGTVIKISSASTNGLDIALIRLHTNLPSTKSVRFHLENTTPQLGDDVHTISNPYGLIGTASKGIYSFVGRIDNNEGATYDQTTMPVFPGSSGGGVFTSNGQCVGLIIALKQSTLNFILPIREVKKWAERENVMWALDPNYPIISDFEMLMLLVGDTVPTPKTNSVSR